MNLRFDDCIGDGFGMGGRGIGGEDGHAEDFGGGGGGVVGLGKGEGVDVGGGGRGGGVEVGVGGGGGVEALHEALGVGAGRVDMLGCGLDWGTGRWRVRGELTCRGGGGGRCG